MRSLRLDDLQVTSFDTTAPAATQALPLTGGEDCFSYMATCPPRTFTAAV
jgi:hypothetical protein